MPVVIANPKSGNARRVASRLDPVLGQRGHVLHFSKSPEHAESLAYESSIRGEPIVIAAGGDGTIHHIVNGLLRNSSNQTRLGLLPAGTANDLVWSIKKQFPDQASYTRRIDAGVLRRGESARYFINVVGIGFTARVAQIATRLRRLPAILKYSLALAISCGRNFSSQEVRVAFDHASAQDVSLLLLSCANGKREGSFALARDALVDDGQLDILLAGSLRRRDLVRYYPSILRGTIPKNDSRVRELRASHIRLQSSAPMCVHLDGEALPKRFTEGLDSFSIELIVKGIEIELFSH